MPATAKLLYLVSQICEVRSFADLAKKMGVDERTVSRAVDILKEHKWLRIERRGHCAIPIPILPRAEDERRTKILLARFKVSPFKGEFLLKEFHDVILFGDDKIDNARPKFLESPLSSENLEYDRYDPILKHASEYHGFQHDGPTQVYQSKEKADLQKANDLMKAAMSAKNGVRLTVFTYRDLSLAGVSKKLPEDLPRRAVDPNSKYVRTLERLAAEHRKWAEQVESDLAKRELEAAATAIVEDGPADRNTQGRR